MLFTFEEFRYGALGRRVLGRTRRFCRFVESVDCVPETIRRTVWDGAQELAEIQMPGGDTVSAATLENDTLPVASRRGTFDEGLNLYKHASLFFGRVAYTHALGIDRPLSVVRFDYADTAFNRPFVRWAPFSLVPHWNLRGEADNGSFADGALSKCMNDGVGERCVQVRWPFGWTATTEQAYVRDLWHGSLLESKRDGSGLLFRRNRYVDPASGRFTQEDPIGLAGGMNLYGFAAGDPVNFSDPFGLAACPPVCGDVFSDLARRLAPLENALNTVGEVTGVNDLGRAGNDIAGGHAIRGGMSIAMALPGVGAGGRLGAKAARYADDFAVAFHHAWPKYLGGAHQQLLEVLPRGLHNAYHSGLDKILPRQAGGGYYQNLSRAQLRQVYRDFEAYTRAFDREHGTRLWEAARREGFR